MKLSCLGGDFADSFRDGLGGLVKEDVLDLESAVFDEHDDVFGGVGKVALDSDFGLLMWRE